MPRRPRTLDHKETATASRRQRVAMPLPALVIVVVVLVSLAASSAWRLAGNSLYFVSTPSMCPTMCVGSLVIDVPAKGVALHVGDTVTFHPPGVTEVFTHRIVSISSDGNSITTEGIATRRVDPWTITPSDVTGVTVASVWGIGWFYRALSFMSIGVVILLYFRRFVSVRDRRDTDRLISILLIAVPLAMMRPLLNAYTVGVTTTKNRSVDVVHIINTGLLPGRFHAFGGENVARVAPGQSVSLRGPVVNGAGVPFRETASLTLLGWIVAGVVVLLPAMNFGYDVARRHYRELHQGQSDKSASVGNGVAEPGSWAALEEAVVERPDGNVDEREPAAATPSVRHIFVLDRNERPGSRPPVSANSTSSHESSQKIKVKGSLRA